MLLCFSTARFYPRSHREPALIGADTLSLCRRGLCCRSRRSPRTTNGSRTLSPFTTGNPFLGTNLLAFSIRRGSGALKGLTPLQRETHFSTIFVDISIWRGFGALKRLRDSGEEIWGNQKEKQPHQFKFDTNGRRR